MHSNHHFLTERRHIMQKQYHCMVLPGMEDIIRLPAP